MYLLSRKKCVHFHLFRLGSLVLNITFNIFHLYSRSQFHWRREEEPKYLKETTHLTTSFQVRGDNAKVEGGSGRGGAKPVCKTKPSSTFTLTFSFLKTKQPGKKWIRLAICLVPGCCGMPCHGWECSQLEQWQEDVNQTTVVSLLLSPLSTEIVKYYIFTKLPSQVKKHLL